VYLVQAVDTTGGAGDMYAAGLLYGLSQGSATRRVRPDRVRRRSGCRQTGPRLETIGPSQIEQIKMAGRNKGATNVASTATRRRLYCESYFFILTFQLPPRSGGAC